MPSPFFRTGMPQNAKKTLIFFYNIAHIVR